MASVVRLYRTQKHFKTVHCRLFERIRWAGRTGWTVNISRCYLTTKWRVMWYTVLWYTVMWYIVMWYTVMWYTVMWYTEYIGMLLTYSFRSYLSSNSQEIQRSSHAYFKLTIYYREIWVCIYTYVWHFEIWRNQTFIFSILKEINMLNKI